MCRHRFWITAIRRMDQALELLDDIEEIAPGSTLEAAAALQHARDRATITYRATVRPGKNTHLTKSRAPRNGSLIGTKQSPQIESKRRRNPPEKK